MVPFAKYKVEVLGAEATNSSTGGNGSEDESGTVDDVIELMKVDKILA